MNERQVEYARQQQEQVRQQQEQQRHKRVADAVVLFKEHPAFPLAVVQVQDRSNELKDAKPIGIRLSDPLIEHSLKYLDIHGEAYLQLVDNQALQEAFEAVMDDIARTAWFQASALPIDALSPPMPFTNPRPEQVQLKRILDRTHFWKTEGYRRLASLRTLPPKVPKQTRTTHEPRPELLAGKEIVSRKIAALALGYSERTLDRRVEDGLLTPIGTGHYKRFKAKDIQRLLNQTNSVTVDRTRH